MTLACARHVVRLALFTLTGALLAGGAPWRSATAQEAPAERGPPF
jgi:hypothetical protein